MAFSLTGSPSSAEASPLVSSLSWFEGSNRIHVETGYWGPPNSVHQFCEPHYAVTPWIAEFYNTISSFLFTACAIYALYQEPKLRRDPYVLAANVILASIGLGSAAFHATMRYDMQLCDEIPMVCYITCLLLGNVTVTHPPRDRKSDKIKAEKSCTTPAGRVYPHPWIPNATASFLWVLLTISTSVAIVAVYVALEKYEMFLLGFTIVVLLHMAVALRSPLHPNYGRQQLWCRYMSLGFILLGKAVWEVEHRMCSSIPGVYPLHVVWHVLSCVSAYYGTLALFIIRQPPQTVGGDSHLYLNVWGFAPHFYPPQKKLT